MVCVSCADLKVSKIAAAVNDEFAAAACFCLYLGSVIFVPTSAFLTADRIFPTVRNIEWRRGKYNLFL